MVLELLGVIGPSLAKPTLIVITTSRDHSLVVHTNWCWVGFYIIINFSRKEEFSIFHYMSECRLGFGLMGNK